MKIIAVLFFILNVINFFSQSTPCYLQKRFCDNRKIKDCNELVSFNEETDTYFSKKILVFFIQETA